jgi:hypothetical protein
MGIYKGPNLLGFFVIEAYPTNLTEDMQIPRVSFSSPTLLAMTVILWVYIIIISHISHQPNT